MPESDNSQETSDQASAGDQQQAPGPDSTSSSNVGGGGSRAVLDYITARRMDAVLAGTRLCTVIFTLLYLAPWLGSISASSAYQKALISNAATSALRLHQRLPRFQMTAEYMALLLGEDSCHYLLYSIIFIFNQPVTLSLLPISLFASLHLSSYARTLLEKYGSRGVVYFYLNEIVTKYSQTIFPTIAMSEIFMMPVIIMGIFSGLVTLFAPFLYYRFIVLRYSSRRNPYTRSMFYELRIAVSQLALKPQCPVFIRNLLLKGCELVARLAPTVQ